MTPAKISKTLTNITGVQITSEHINDAYPLGKLENAPVKVEFLSYSNKLAILQNCSKLKGSSISISYYYTELQRKTQKTLRRHLNAVRANNHHSYIKGERLFVHQKLFTLSINYRT